MIKLKVKCSICGKEESNEELVKKVAEIIKEHGLKAEHYLNFLNLMSGKCLNSDEHSFLFDEEFTKQIEEITAKFKINTTETEKLKAENEGIKKEANELVIKLKELRSKEESNDQRLDNIMKNDDDLITEIELSTGIGNIEIWY